MSDNPERLKRKTYKNRLQELQVELVKLQEWIQHKKLKICVLFEGRDAAGKGGVIQRITHRLNPRVCRIVALGTPSPREESQWYYQRYIQHLPAGGEMALFDRSWYTLAGVERVMGFYPEEVWRDFYQTCPEFENMLTRSGMILIKYWFAISSQEQERRFESRLNDPTKLWKLSKMDLESRSRWGEYTEARDEMLKHTHTKEHPWWIVDANDKRCARLNCIEHLLSIIPYKELDSDVLELEPRKDKIPHDLSEIKNANFVPLKW